MKINLTQVGTPKTIETSRGQAEKNWCKSKEFGDKFLNYWVNNYTRAWKVGMEVEVDKVEEREYTNKDGNLAKSYDIKFPNKEDKISKQLEELNSRVLKILMMVEEIGRKLVAPPKDDYPVFEDEPNFDQK